MGHQLKVLAGSAFNGGSVLGCKTPDFFPNLYLCLSTSSVLPEFVLSGFLPVSGLSEHPCWETQQWQQSTRAQHWHSDSLGVPKHLLCSSSSSLWRVIAPPKRCLLGHATQKLGMGREFRVSHTSGQSSENHPFQTSINLSLFEVMPDFELFILRQYKADPS